MLCCLYVLKLLLNKKGFSLQTVAPIVSRKALPLGQPTALFTQRFWPSLGGTKTQHLSKQCQWIAVSLQWKNTILFWLPWTWFQQLECNVMLCMSMYEVAVLEDVSWSVRRSRFWMFSSANSIKELKKISTFWTF